MTPLPAKLTGGSTSWETLAPPCKWARAHLAALCWHPAAESPLLEVLLHPSLPTASGLLDPGTPGQTSATKLSSSSGSVEGGDLIRQP